MEEAQEPGAGAETTTLYLVRHAHADWQPSEARGLSARGAASARALADRFATVGIHAIYSSPSRRALQTVEPLAERLGLQPVIVDRLRERELVASSAEEFEAAVEATWRDPARPYGDGESNQAAQARGLEVVRTLLARHPGERIMAATHGSLLVLMLNGLDPSFGYEFWRTLTFPDIYELTFRGDRLMRVRREWEDGGT
jgi:2,3-bisphosphoglycerate-dependent phosphoglycerate mutase